MREIMAARLKELRGNKSQKEVADKIGVSLSSYQKYEMGLRVPRDEVKLEIAKLYKRSVQSIFYSKG